MAGRFERARRVALDVSPLRESVPYRSLWLGQLVSLIGTNMRVVAAAYQVFQITDSTVAVGLIGLVEVVPLIVFSIIGGAIGDRMDRRLLLLRTQSGLLVTSTLLTLVALMDSPPLALIYVLLGVSAAITAIDQPTRTALAPSLVREDQIASVAALRQVVFQTTQIIGPAIGGVVIGAFGVAAVYGIDAVSFVAGLVALRWVPARPPSTVDDRTRFESIREGMRFALRTQAILAIFAIDLVAMIFGMPRAVFPALAQNTFGLGAGGLGLLFAAPSAGALLGALSSGWVRIVRRRGVAVIFSVAAWGLAITLAGLSVFSFALTLFFLAVAGAADVFSAVFRGTILLESTPDHLRGRLSAANIMVVTGGPRVGDVEAGVVAEFAGAPGSIVIGGLACLVGTAVVAWRLPSLRAYRAPKPTAPEAAAEAELTQLGSGIPSGRSEG
ncbi:MAG: MFS transporter [Actinomycetota bacterium]